MKRLFAMEALLGLTASLYTLVFPHADPDAMSGYFQSVSPAPQHLQRQDHEMHFYVPRVPGSFLKEGANQQQALSGRQPAARPKEGTV